MNLLSSIYYLIANIVVLLMLVIAAYNHLVNDEQPDNFTVLFVLLVTIQLNNRTKSQQ